MEEINFNTTEVDGRTRAYILYTPKNLPKEAPLVFVLHGFTDHNRNMMETSGMNAVTKKA